ncbi:MAG: hypothetical protein GF411_14675 [Candidatus Lokiarchaeota archaeon]|nr:hypothetical protein [Candidatus Lokiarchaeota archaeon]
MGSRTKPLIEKRFVRIIKDGPYSHDSDWWCPDFDNCSGDHNLCYEDLRELLRMFYGVNIYISDLEAVWILLFSHPAKDRVEIEVVSHNEDRMVEFYMYRAQEYEKKMEFALNPGLHDVMEKVLGCKHDDMVGKKILPRNLV